MIGALVGKWSVDVQIQSPDGGLIVGSGTFNAEDVSLGRGIHSVMSIDLKGLGPYEETVIWGFDQVNNEVRNLSIISDGRIRDHAGKWIDDQTMELRWVGRHKEERMTEDITISILSPEEVRGNIVGRMGDRQISMIDYVLRRS